jgi:hypothetical protein
MLLSIKCWACTMIWRCIVAEGGKGSGRVLGLNFEAVIVKSPLRQLAYLCKYFRN